MLTSQVFIDVELCNWFEMTEYKICWSCSKRTRVVETEFSKRCEFCYAEFKGEQDQTRDESGVQIIEQIQLKLDGELKGTYTKADFKKLIDGLYTLKRIVPNKSPILLVSPIEGVDDAYDQLYKRVNTFLPGLKPILENSALSGGTVYMIRFVYEYTIGSPYRRISWLLFVFTLLSSFLAGIYNYSYLQKSLGVALVNDFGGFEFSKESMIYSLQFAGTLIGILVLKDFQSIVAMIKKQSSELISFFIPVPPVFELGTVGSLLRLRRVPLNRKNLFYASFTGPFFSWIGSLVIFVMGLSMTEFAKNDYGQHSIVFTNEYQSLILNILMKLFLGTAETGNYVLHPIALAGLAGLYINGLNLLPLASFNGGYMLRAIGGAIVHRVITSVLLMTMLFFFFFFMQPLIFLGITVIMINARMGTPDVLNDLKKVTILEKILFILSSILAIISFPMII
ncbi:MAG: hypothetical protein INQ03_09755 [Candidatus Heimdallarchaeota archaeon]|nr:hypothetical protein [Candidatus Heimdallarchaeota archaeon]